MFLPVPNGEQLIEGMESEGGSADIEYTDDNDGSSDASEESEEVESPPHTERRSKQTQDPPASQGKAVMSSVRNPKRTRNTTPNLTEKSIK